MKHIKEFDGLRGLLALWVFGAHVIELGPYWSATRFVHANWAVDIFIILSGFVIFHLLTAGESYRAFITRRFFRLFPVFAVCFLIALALYGALRIDDELAFGVNYGAALQPHLVAHATMLHGAVPNEVLPRSALAILPPAWSISVEWQFYLLAPVLFAFAVRPQLGAAIVVAVLVAARALHEVGALGVVVPGLPRHLTFGMDAFLPLKLEFFAVGAASFWLWRKMGERGAAHVMTRRNVAGAVLLAALAAWHSPAIAMWIAGFALLLRAHFATAGSTAGLTGVLNSAPLQFAGRISYCLYLLHMPVIVLVREMISRSVNLRAPVFEAALVVVSLVLALAGAWLLHIAVEQPFIRLGRRLAGNRPAHVPASPVRPVPL